MEFFGIILVFNYEGRSMMQKTFLLQLLLAVISLALLLGMLYFARSVLMPLVLKIKNYFRKKNA